MSNFYVQEIILANFQAKGNKILPSFHMPPLKLSKSPHENQP